VVRAGEAIVRNRDAVSKVLRTAVAALGAKDMSPPRYKYVQERGLETRKYREAERERVNVAVVFGFQILQRWIVLDFCATR